MSDRLPPELEARWEAGDVLDTCDGGGGCNRIPVGWARFADLQHQWVDVCDQCAGRERPRRERILAFVPHPQPPVYPGETIGWRAWVVVTDWRGPRLRSLFHDVVWPTDDWLYADGAHARPQEQDPWFLDQGNGWHGVCAARDRKHLSGMTRYMSRNEPRYVEQGDDGYDLVAIGECGLAGLIVPYERGYRAQRARVVSLLLPYVAWELVDPLARAYRVPVGLDDILQPPGDHRG